MYRATLNTSVDCTKPRRQGGGIVFDPVSFTGRVIREDADYAGVRIEFVGHLDNARVHMQIDIGFGDVITPGPETLTYPTILDFPAPILAGYNRETVVAEKLQALVQLRMLNTRMKDYFDLWLLTRQPELDKAVLSIAINGHSQTEEWILIPPRSNCQRLLEMTQSSENSGQHF